MGSKRAAMVGLQGLWEVCPELESCGAFAQKLCAGTFPAETVPAEDCWTGGATFDATSSDDDDDNYSTIFEEDFDEDQEDLEEYAQMLLDYKGDLEEEEKWIAEMEQKLVEQVSDSLTTLKACLMAVEAQKGQGAKGALREQRRSSVEQVVETRRASAAQIRAQSLKAEKKVKRAKARDLKARKALVQALKKQRDKKVAKKKRSRDDWDHMKKSAEDEFELSLQNMKLEIRNSSPK